MTAPAASARPRRLAPILLFGLPLACLVWAFGSTLLDLAGAWAANEQDSHGFLVPPFAALLLWLRRDKLETAALRPCLWGAALLAAGIGLRLFGAYYYYVWLDSVTLVPCAAGLCLLLGGRAAWRWAWPSVLFLFFMVPLPYRVASALSGPLQRTAAASSTFVMQVLGMPALAEGNVIQLNDATIDVVEACSGLRMLVVFFALSAAVALIVRRPPVDRLVVLASAIPIAVLANIARVTVTGVLHQMTDSTTANAFFHDVAGWLMMPLALGLLALELKVLSRLVVAAPARPAPAFRPLAPRRRRLPPRQTRPGAATGPA
jgi:exosortase